MLMACGDEALFITFHMLYGEYTMMGKWDREIQRVEGKKKRGKGHSHPRTEEVLHLVDAIRKKYPLLHKEQVFGTMNGLKLYLQQNSDHVIQNAFYNSWKYDHYITNIFLFTPDGMIHAMVINMPGAMHDSMAAGYGFIYKKLTCLFDRCGAKAVVDSTFLLKRNGFLIKSSQKDV
eukprot:11788205-Ditylum_brightwellii.AAC.1